MIGKRAHRVWRGGLLALSVICMLSIATARSLSEFSAHPLFARAPFKLASALQDPKSGCKLNEGCGQQEAEQWLDKNHAELDQDALFSLVVALAPLSDTVFGRKWLARTLTNPSRASGRLQAPLLRVQTMAALALARSQPGRQTLMDAVQRGGSVGDTAIAALESAGPPDGLMLLQTAGKKDKQLVRLLERSADLRVFGALRDVLRRGDVDIQTSAALVLARQGNSEALELVSHWRASKLEDPRVLAASAEVLLLLDAPDAAKAFAALAAADTPSALALAERYPRAQLADKLIERLDEMTPEQRRHAYAVLGTLQSNSAATALARELAQRPSADAALALATSPAANARALLEQMPMTRQRLRALLVRHYISGKDAAILRHTSRLQEVFRKASAEPHLQPTARWAIAQLERTSQSPAWAKSERWARKQSSALLRSVIQPEHAQRFVAIAELSRRKDPAADPSVWLHAADVDLRLAVLRGLARGDGLCEGDRAATLYRREQEPRVRRSLMAAIAPCKNEPVLRQLLQVASELDPDAQVRAAALDAEAGSSLAQHAHDREITWLELGACRSCASQDISVHASDGSVTIARPADDGTVILLGFPPHGAYARQSQPSVRGVRPDQW